MAEQLKINYSSAYLKYQLLKGAWYIHKQSIVSQIPMVYEFINNKIIVEDNQEEPKMTLPYTIKLTNSTTNQIQNIAVIPIIGSLMKHDYCGAPGMQTMISRIKRADEDDSISGILFQIDSPGGTVDGTQEFSNAIKNCSKPTVGFADGLAASAAYWAISSTDMVIAKDTTTEVGSIGVVLSFIDVQPAYEKEGFVFHDIFADQSDEKWKEILDAKKGDYSTLKEWTLNPLAIEFQKAVKGNRPNVKDKAMRGRVYLAKLAKRMGLIDKIGNFDFAIQELNKLISNKNINIMAKKEDKVVEMTISEDEKGLFEKIKAAIKPEIKDISEDTKADYERQVSESKETITGLENTITELNTNIEDYGIEKERIEGELNQSNDSNILIDAENKALKLEIAELKTQITKKVIEPTLVESDDDKLEIGKLGAEEAAWLEEAKKFQTEM